MAISKCLHFFLMFMSTQSRYFLYYVSKLCLILKNNNDNSLNCQYYFKKRCIQNTYSNQYHHWYLDSFHFRMTPLPSVPWASVGIYDDQRSFTAQHSQFLANHLLMSTLIDFIIIILRNQDHSESYPCHWQSVILVSFLKKFFIEYSRYVKLKTKVVMTGR